MKRRGISTAHSEQVREMMVKPISPEPDRAASNGFAALHVARDVLDHHDGVVHDEARADGRVPSTSGC